MTRELVTELVTAANLNEERYLAANPDVKNAGVSARRHFEVCGQTEGRIQFRELSDITRSLESRLRSASGKVKDFNGFSSDAPSHQVALDLWKGDWWSAMPSEAGLLAGHIDHFKDGRVPWADPIVGGIRGKNIIELGPFEAYNSYQFDRMGADRVISIENSPHNFLKCLIVKNIFNLRTEFLLGDFNLYRPDKTVTWDVIWASGVLYHLTAPVQFLHTIGRWGNQIFIWTHYYDETILDENHPETVHFDPKRDVIVEYAGREIKLHHRTYPDSNAGSTYAGGGEAHSYWMERDDILFILKEQGFEEIHMGTDNPHYSLGPACFFIARRTGRENSR